MTVILRVTLAALVSMSAAAYGQNNVAPPTGGPAHSGTAMLDAMGIVAGAAVEAGRPVHPGTVILDSMGIFAGLPVPDAPHSDTVAVTTVIPN